MNELSNAVVERDLSKVIRLLTAGEDVNAFDPYGSRPLISAIKLNSVEMAHLLIEAGADVCAKDTIGETALFHAALSGHCDLVSKILEKAGSGRFDVLSESDLSMIKNKLGRDNIVNTLIEYGFVFPNW